MTSIDQGPEHDETLAQASAVKTLLLSLAIGASVGLTGVVYSALDTRVTVIEREGSPPMRERLAAVEARQDALQRQLDSDIRELREVVKSMNAKLDRLVEQR